jgi:hypothetical protein
LLKIPTANHPRFAALRIKGIGLMQAAGGSGESVSSILKSPFGDSKTPADEDRLSVKGAVGSQIRAASTCKAPMPEGAPSGVVPAGQDQSLSINFDASVRTHRGIELVDHADLPGGLHAANYIPIHALDDLRRRQCRGTATPEYEETGWTPIPPLNPSFVRRRRL